MPFSKSSPTISTGGMNAILLGLQQMGFDLELLKKEVGLDKIDLSNTHLRINCEYATKSFELAFNIWKKNTADLALTTKDTHKFFGLTHGSKYQPLNLGIIGHLLTTANTGMDALLSYERYQVIFGEGIRIRFESGHNKDSSTASMIARLELHPKLYKANIEDELIDSFFIAFFNCIRILTGKQAPLLRVELSRTEPKTSIAMYSEQFACEVLFGQAENRILFSKHWLDVPLMTANLSLHSLLEAQSKLVLQQLTTKDKFTHLVRSQILKSINGNKIELGLIASNLNMSPRTLQRKLKENGLGFQNLLNEVRTEFAKQQLLARNISIDEQAYLLGYSEPSVYRKSFKKWTGFTPTEFIKASTGKP